MRQEDNSIITLCPSIGQFFINELPLLLLCVKVCRNTRCAFFFFIDYKNRLIFLSCDILRISLIYAFATSK